MLNKSLMAVSAAFFAHPSDILYLTTSTFCYNWQNVNLIDTLSAKKRLQ